MSTSSRLVPFAVASVALLAAGTARAQPAPTFKYGSAEELKEIKEVVWKAVAEAGLLVTTGNSENKTFTATATASRLDKRNKLEVAVGLAYARSTIQIASDTNGNGTIGPSEIQDSSATTAKSWQTKLRYDRFLTEFNSLYVAGLLGADEPAGKQLVGGGQVGYSRRLFKNDHHEVVAEVGYDLSYEDLVVGDPLVIHSARVFSGYKGTISDKTAIDGSIEVLSNLNTLATLPDSSGPIEDTRVTAMGSISTKLTKSIAFTFSLGAKFDNRPAPRAPIGGLGYDPGFVPVSDRLDTITKASLQITLL